MNVSTLLRASAICLLLGAGLAAEACVLLELILLPGDPEMLHLVAMLGLHLFAAAALAEAVRLRYRRAAAGAPDGWQYAVLLAVLLPIFGPLLVFVLALRPPAPAAQALVGQMSPMEFRKQQAEAQLAREAQGGVADAAVEVIGEALKDEHKDKRIGAVEALKSIGNKQAVELLGRSLNNTMFDVRFHAVEALSGIGKKFSGRIAQAQARLEQHDTADNAIALGRVYFEYANLEMEEEAVQQHLYRSAVHHLRAGIERSAQVADEVQLELAMSYERVRNLNGARQIYQQLLRRDGESYAALVGLARVQFAEADFMQLRQTCRELLRMPTADPRHVEVLQFWAERAQR